MTGLERLRGLCEGLPAEPDEPTLAAVEAAFAALSPEDVRLDEHTASLFKRRATDDWWTVCLFRLPQAQLSLFVFPEGSVVPLHDHPGMHVWTRVLLGRIELQTFDWVTPRNEELLARGSGVHEVVAGAPLIHATPERRNVHRIEAKAPSAVLDLFAPPYDELADRRCHYYRVSAQAPVAADAAILLREVPG